jgi:flagellar biosynthesis protein FlhF
MKIKTFYAKTMAEAMRDIKEALGPDALLLSTKEIPRRSGAWGRSSGFEVVAACDQVDDVDVVSSSFQKLSGNQRQSGYSSGMNDIPLMGDNAATYTPNTLLKKQRVANTEKNNKPGKSVSRQELAEEIRQEKEAAFKSRIAQGVYQELVECDVDITLAHSLILNAWENLATGQRRSRSNLLRSVTHTILDLIARPSSKTDMPGKKIVAFIGPTGVGKTTSLAKLAAHLALEKNKKVLLLTLDSYRIGAVEQLRCYAGLMGIPFRFVDHVSELPRVVEDNKQRDFILIDTAGRGPRDMAAMQSLATYLKESEHIESHLVLSASTKQADLRKIVDQFEVCRPDHLLFTKLDETSTPGPILNELVRTKKQFSYYTDGQSVPDDLHAVPRDRIIDIVLNRTENAFKE